MRMFRTAITLAVAASALASCERLGVPRPVKQQAVTHPVEAPLSATHAAPPVALAPAAATHGPLSGSPGSFAPLVHRVRPSVVSVFTASVEMTGMEWGFNDPTQRFTRGQGTGFIIASDGEVLTNNHVVEGAQFIEVQLDDGRRFGATVLGRDPRLDVALLRIKASGVALTPVVLGDSDNLDVGDWVMAIGNPYGLSQTVTAGIISAIGRTGREVSLGDDNFGNLLQTDASINPGNSGGPLVNLSGEVIGINVAIRREAQGLSFAIPINMARVVVPQLRAYGHVVRSWLGVAVREVSDQVVALLHLPDAHGAMVFEVEANSPAEAVGLHPGDVIRRFDGHDVRDSTELPWLASSAGVGHHASVEFVRDGRLLTVDTTLAALPDSAQAILRPVVTVRKK